MLSASRKHCALPSENRRTAASLSTGNRIFGEQPNGNGGPVSCSPPQGREKVTFPRSGKPEANISRRIYRRQAYGFRFHAGKGSSKQKATRISIKSSGIQPSSDGKTEPCIYSESDRIAKSGYSTEEILYHRPGCRLHRFPSLLFHEL